MAGRPWWSRRCSYRVVTGAGGGIENIPNPCARFENTLSDAPTPDPPSTHGRAALAFIFITVVLDMLALGMIIRCSPG
jgi:hypothetical protein